MRSVRRSPNAASHLVAVLRVLMLIHGRGVMQIAQITGLSLASVKRHIRFAKALGADIRRDPKRRVYELRGAGVFDLRQAKRLLR